MASILNLGVGKGQANPQGVDTSKIQSLVSTLGKTPYTMQEFLQPIEPLLAVETPAMKLKAAQLKMELQNQADQKEYRNELLKISRMKAANSGSSNNMTPSDYRFIQETQRSNVQQLKGAYSNPYNYYADLLRYQAPLTNWLGADEFANLKKDAESDITDYDYRVGKGGSKVNPNYAKGTASPVRSELLRQGLRLPSVNNKKISRKDMQVDASKTAFPLFTYPGMAKGNG